MEIETKRQQRKFLFGFALVVFLTIVLLIALFAFRDPLLYNNNLTVQAVTDKSSYTQFEDVSITAYVINGKNEPVNRATAVSYKVFDSTGQEVYSCITLINLPIPPPTFPAHTRDSYSPHIWNQKNSNYTFVEPGNYTIEVALQYGTSECSIQITPL